MSNRAVAPVLAVLISSLAGMALTVSAIAAPATEDKAEASADQCLAAPKGETPKGAHWYYRLEKGTKRKCWYLADAAAKANKATASSAPPPAAAAPSVNRAPPRAPEAAIQPSVANARAELANRAPKTAAASDDATLSETIWPQPEAQAASIASNGDQSASGQPETTGTGVAATPPAKDSAITSRWPDANMPSTTGNQSTAPIQTASQQTAAPQAASPKDKLTAPVAAGQFHGISLDSTSMLLIMLAGVLTIVAIVGRMIIKYAGYRQAKNRSPRRPIWDNVAQENDASHAYESLLQPRRSQFATEPTEANDPGSEIEQLLQRVSKRAAA
ncbi:hypothetical protein [Bradyrhizobium sp. SYSU BS000235]|uniref:hypothetical protein n=1 Tax=Bradyrhizobium sp. SYSU BS000235 TaxID=3411332 RepID=UPI003C726FA7